METDYNLFFGKNDNPDVTLQPLTKTVVIDINDGYSLRNGISIYMYDFSMVKKFHKTLGRAIKRLEEKNKEEGI